MKLTAARMKVTRELLGASQEAMAHLMGASFVSINRWERGHAKPGGLWVEVYLLLDRALRLGVAGEDIRKMSDSCVSRVKFFCKVRSAVLEKG